LHKQCDSLFKLLNKAKHLCIGLVKCLFAFDLTSVHFHFNIIEWSATVAWVGLMCPSSVVPAVSYYAYYGKKLDPEPWRCRRTDGKKWRCSKEAHPDSKYCERHMHRGRNRSRKPVESKTASPAHPSQPQLPTVTTTTRETAPLDSLTAGGKSHGLSLGGAGSSQLHVDASNAHYRYGSKYGYTPHPLLTLIATIKLLIVRSANIAWFGCKLYS
jgi:hypothetical protein